MVRAQPASRAVAASVDDSKGDRRHSLASYPVMGQESSCSTTSRPRNIQTCKSGAFGCSVERRRATYKQVRARGRTQIMIAKKLILKALEKIDSGFLEVVCPEATYSFGNPGASLKAILAVHNERFFYRLLFVGDVGLGEAYMDGDWSSPDLVAVVRLVVRNMKTLEAENTRLSALSRISDLLFHRRNKNTLRGSRRN